VAGCLSELLFKLLEVFEDIHALLGLPELGDVLNRAKQPDDLPLVKRKSLAHYVKDAHQRHRSPLTCRAAELETC